MEILHICNAYQTNPLYQLLFTELSHLGLTQEVIAPGESGGDLTIEDVRVYKYKRDTTLIGRVLWPVKIKRLKSFAEKKVCINKVDIIHAHTLFSDGAVAYRLYKAFGTKYSVAVRNTDLNDYFRIPLFRPLGYKILENSKRVYLISEANKQQFLNTLPEKRREDIASKIKIIPNGINEFWLKSVYTGNRVVVDKVSLIYAGDICHNKNIHTIAAAVEEDAKGLIKGFEAVGLKDGESGSYITSIKKQIETSSRIHLSPKCKKEELLEKFRKADVYIQPSFTETFGLSYIEALTQGLPVIYSKGQGIDGMFEDGLVGYAVDPSSPKDILSKISMIRDRYEAISDNISHLDFSRFRWSGIANDYINDYKLI